jgi:hypothetical protein
MTYEIREGKAFVKIVHEGKEGELVLRKLKFREWAYSLDEFMTVRAGGGTDIKIGAMMLAVLPKSIVAAPFDIKDNNTALDTLEGLDLALELSNALMELNGVGEKKEKK